MIAAVFSPFLGLFVDKYGHRMTITLMGSLIMIFAHFYELVLPSAPTCDRCWASLGPLVLLGLSYTTYAVVLWGALPYMVESRALGTAFGICTTFQNLGTVIAPPILGYIIDYTKDMPPKSQKGYFYVEVFFIIVSIMAFVFNFGVYLYDKKKRENLLQDKEPMI